MQHDKPILFYVGDIPADEKADRISALLDKIEAHRRSTVTAK